MSDDTWSIQGPHFLNCNGALLEGEDVAKIEQAGLVDVEINVRAPKPQ